MARRRIYLDELIDAHEVAAILELASNREVWIYQNRRADMPRPVFDLGPGRVKLWLRPEIERWQLERRR